MYILIFIVFLVCFFFFIIFFFFLQAEDCIRDHCVTGVQTCALPICAISWLEIKAWADLTGKSLGQNDYEILMRLSAAYVNQYYKSEDKSCPSPHLGEPKTRDFVESQMRTLFAMMRNNNG